MVQKAINRIPSDVVVLAGRPSGLLRRVNVGLLAMRLGMLVGMARAWPTFSSTMASAWRSSTAGKKLRVPSHKSSAMNGRSSTMRSICAHLKRRARGQPSATTSR